MIYRVLVTGSRDWEDESVIRQALENIDNSVNVTDYVVLVSGACPTGADRMAEDIAHDLMWEIERHPANWRLHGKRAGFVRNAEMVDMNPNECVAFIRNNSRGASMTLNLCVDAGIHVNVWRA